jgi:hypothetical protein
LRKLDLLLIYPKQSLFKTNKTKNTIIKNNSNQSGRNDGHWLALTRCRANEVDGRHSILEGGQKWPEIGVVAYGLKTPNKYKENKRNTYRMGGGD